MKSEIVLLFLVIVCAAGQSCVENNDCAAGKFCNLQKLCVSVEKVILKPANRNDKPTPAPYNGVFPTKWSEPADTDETATTDFPGGDRSPQYVCNNCNGFCIGGIFCRAGDSCINNTCCHCQSSDTNEDDV